MAKKKQETSEPKATAKFKVVIGKKEIYHAFTHNGREPVLIYDREFQTMTMREQLDLIKDNYGDELALSAKPGDVLELPLPEFAPAHPRPNITAVLLRAGVIKPV